MGKTDETNGRIALLPVVSSCKSAGVNLYDTMKTSKAPYLPLLLISALILLVSPSCDPDVTPLRLNDYEASYVISDGFLKDGELVVTPEISVNVNGPETRQRWDVILSGSDTGFKTIETIETGRTAIFQLTEEEFHQEGTYTFDITICPEGTNKVLRRFPNVTVCIRQETAPTCTITLNPANKESKTFSEGQTINLQCDTEGTLDIQVNDAGDVKDISLSTELPSSLLELTKVYSENSNKARYSYVAKKQSSGNFIVKTVLKEKELKFTFPLNLVPIEAPREQTTFSVKYQEFVFIPDKLPFTVSNNQTTDKTYKLSFFSDNKPIRVRTEDPDIPGTASFNSSTEWNEISLNSPTLFFIDTKSFSAGQQIPISILIFDSKTGKKEGEINFNFKVYDLITTWYSYPDGKEISNGMLYSEKASRFILKTDFGTEAAFTVATKDKTENKNLQLHGPSSGVSRSFLLEFPSRGEHELEITVSDANVDYKKTKTIQVPCYDVYQCAYSIEGSSVYATLSGATTTAPCKFDFSIDGKLVGVIPYTEAVEYGGKYYTKDVYEYTSFEAFGTEFSVTQGSTLGKINVWSGWIKTAANHAQGKLKELKVTHQATRWVLKDNKYVKETYSPIPYMQVNMTLICKKNNANNLNYLLMQYEYGSVESFFNNYGIHLALYTSD